MTKGKAFELLVQGILIGIGFRRVTSDGVIVYDGSAGQMIVGLGGRTQCRCFIGTTSADSFLL